MWSSDAINEASGMLRRCDEQQGKLGLDPETKKPAKHNPPLSKMWAHAHKGNLAACGPAITNDATLDA